MPLCLTYRVNLGLSLRKTSQALKDIHNISISHQSVANYCKTAALCVKPLVDHFDYKTGNVFTADFNLRMSLKFLITSTPLYAVSHAA